MLPGAVPEAEGRLLFLEVRHAGGRNDLLAGRLLYRIGDVLLQIGGGAAEVMLGLIKPRFAEMIKRNDRSASLAGSGISLPAGQGSFSSLHYDHEALILVGNLAAPFEGKSIGLQYVDSGTNPTAWKCGSKDLEKKLLPSMCREAFGYLGQAEASASQKSLAAQTTLPAPVEKTPAPAAAIAVAAPMPPEPAVTKVVAVAPPPPAAVPAPAPAPTKSSEIEAAESRASAQRVEQARVRKAMEIAEAEKRKPKASKSECVYKPVMTDDDIAKCR